VPCVRNTFRTCQRRSGSSPRASSSSRSGSVGSDWRVRQRNSLLPST
jgi:hypothetical protein